MEKKEHLKKKKVLLVALMLTAAGSLMAQNVEWQGSGAWLTSTPLIIYDTTYLEVHFKLSANSASAVNITVTPPAGVDIVPSVPTPVTGNTVTYTGNLTGGTTYTLTPMTTADVVHFRVPVTTANCNASSGTSINVGVSNAGGTIYAATGSKTVNLSFTKPMMNANFRQSNIAYSLQGEMHTYAVLITASQGVINDCKITVRTAYQFALLQNFKFNSTVIPTAQITTTTSGTDRTFTINLTRAFIAANGRTGKITNVPDTIYIDAIANNNCGVKTVYVNGWLPASAATSAASCAQIGTDRTFTMTMPGPAGVPNIQRVGTNAAYASNHTFASYTALSINTMDFSQSPTYYLRNIFNNVGGAHGFITNQEFDAAPGSDWSPGTYFIDTSNIYYYITAGYNGTGSIIINDKKVDCAPGNGSYVSCLKTIQRAYRIYKAPYTDSVILIQLNIPDSIPAGGSIVFYVGMKVGDFYEHAATLNHSVTLQGSGGTTALAANPRLYCTRVEQTTACVDTCGKPGNVSGSYADYYPTSPSISRQQPILNIRPSQQKGYTLIRVHPGNILNITNDAFASMELHFQLPTWMDLDVATYADAAVKWIRTDNGAEWPHFPATGGITNHGGGHYSMTFRPADHAPGTTGTADATAELQIRYVGKANTWGYTVNQIDTIEYWIDLNMFTAGGTATAARPTFEKLGRAGQVAIYVVEQDGLVLEDFYPYRVSRGYTDIDNNNLADDATLAHDTDINHYQYQYNDTGYFYWSGYMANGPYTDLNLLFSSSWVSSTNGLAHSGNYYYPLPALATFQYKRGNTWHNLSADSLTYTRSSDGKAIALTYKGYLVANDSIRCQLPIHYIGYNNSDINGTSFNGLGYATNAASYPIFTIPDSDRHGKDTIGTQLLDYRTVGYYSDTMQGYYYNGRSNYYGKYTNFVGATTIGNNVIVPPINSNTSPWVNNNPYFGAYMHIGGGAFRREARMILRLDSVTITMPKGYRFDVNTTNVSWALTQQAGISTSVTYYAGYPGSSGAAYTQFGFGTTVNPGYMQADYLTRTELRMDLHKYFDPNFPQSPLAAGKRPGITEYELFYIYPFFRATKGASLQGDTAMISYNFYSYVDNTQRRETMAIPLIYTGEATKLTVAQKSLEVTTARFDVPSIMYQNPHVSVTNNNNWLYVAGNVKNVELRDPYTGAVIATGTGYKGCWVQVSPTMAAGAGVMFTLNAQYEGAPGRCTDSLTLYCVSGYSSSWSPTTDSLAPNVGAAIYYPFLDLDNEDYIDYGGDFATIQLIIKPASVNGALTVENVNPLIPTDRVAYGDNQKLTVTLAAIGQTNDGALRGYVDVIVPAGQKYVAGTARIIYPDSTTPRAIDAAFETYLIAQIGGATTTNRTFTFHYGAAVGDSTLLIDGTGLDPVRTAKLTLELVPDCNTDLSGFSYKGTLHGESACGVIADGDGHAIESRSQYPLPAGAYLFSVTPTFPSSRTDFGPIDTEIDIVLDIKKIQGTNNIAINDSVELLMHEAFNITTASYAGSYSSIFGIGSNVVTGTERSIKMTFPASWFNTKPSGGLDSTVSYNLHLTYNPANFTPFESPQQEFKAHVITIQSFGPACPITQKTVVGSHDTTFGVSVFSPYPAMCCTSVPAGVSITNFDDFLYTYDWYRDEAMNTYLGAGPVPPNFLTTTNQYDTLFVRMKAVGGGVLGLVRYPYETYPNIVVDFSPDTTCLNVPTNFVDLTTMRGLPASGSNWRWIIDDSIFYATSAPSHTFTVTGNHTVKLIFTSIYGCVDSLQKTIYVRDRIHITTCPADFMMTLQYGQCDTIPLTLGSLSYQLGSATSDPDVVITNNAPAAFTFGVTHVTWYATDTYCANLYDSCDQLVVVNRSACGTNDTVYDGFGVMYILSTPYTVTDIDGNTYQTIRVGCNCWTQSNLVTTRYADGTAVPDIKKFYSAEYPDSNGNLTIYGYLYNYNAAIGLTTTTDVCPTGWSLPTEADYVELLGYNTLNLKTNTADPNYWLNELVSDSTQFSAIPAGQYIGTNGQSARLYTDTWFWTSEPVSGGLGRACHLYVGCPSLNIVNMNQYNGISVRCIKQ
jgi:uncharacterized protein (TIGR02145 family)